jgi:hypothetical protein
LIGGSTPCGDVKIPQAGTAVTIRLNMEAGTGRFVATATQGGLVLQFERRPAANSMFAFSLGLAGTASGSADDEGVSLGGGVSVPPSGTRLTVPSSIPLSGEIPSPMVSDMAMGTLDGIVTFSRNGVSSTCPAGAVHWTLNRIP